MNPIRNVFGHAGRRLLAACTLMLGCLGAAHAQGLTVTAITANGQSAQTLAGVQVRMPGAAASRAK